MRYLEGAPIFAVEVRSANDYDAVAEREMRAKRADYFAAETRVVWDVDLQSPVVVRKYVAERGPEQIVASYRRGEIADAEPAVIGWSIEVNELFDDQED